MRFFRGCLTAAVAFFASLAFADVARAGSTPRCVDYAPPITATGSLVLPGETERVGLVGDMASLLCRAQVGYGYEASVHIVDVSDPSSPRQVAAIDPASVLEWGTAPLGLAVTPSHLFLTVGRLSSPSRLLAFDISNPESPKLVSTTDVTFPLDVEVRNGFAFIANSAGLDIYDVSDPSAPVIAATVSLGQSMASVAVSERIVCVAGGDLHIVDATHPRSPVVLGTLPGWRTHDIAIEGPRIVSVGKSDLRLGRIDDTTPMELGSLDLALPGRSIELVGDRAFFVAERREIQRFSERETRYGKIGVVDLRDPAHPRLTGHVPAPEDARDLVIAGDTALVAAGVGGFVILDLSELSIGTPRAQVPFSTAAYSVRIAGNLAFVGLHDDKQGAGRLDVVDLSDPDAPLLRGSVDLDGVPRAIALVHGIAFVGGDDLHVVDVGDPDLPRVVATLPERASTLALAGKRLFFGEARSRIDIADVSDPTAPFLEQSLPLAAVPRGISANPDNVFIATGRGLRVLDVSVPGGAVEIFAFEEGSAFTEVSLSDTVLVALQAAPARLRALSVASPGAPYELGAVDINGTGRVVVERGLAYVVHGAGGIDVVDVSEPASPRLVGTIGTPERAQDAALFGDMLAVAEGWYVGGQLTLLPAHCRSATIPVPTDAEDVERGQPFRARLASSRPFPASHTVEIVMDRPSSLRVAVHDVSGRAVRTLRDSAVQGTVRETWDGRDDLGRKVSSGIYWIRVSSGAAGRAFKVVAIR